MIYNTLSTKAIKKKLAKERAKKLIPTTGLLKLSESLKAQGKKIVLTTGTLDMFGPGQARFLSEAKSLGDVLVVCVTSETAVNQSTHTSPVFMNEKVRAELACNLKCVDYVTLGNDDRPHAELLLLNPDIYFVSERHYKHAPDIKTEKHLIKKNKGKVVVRKTHLPHYSRAVLLDHIANLRVMQIMEDYLKTKIPGFYIDTLQYLRPADYGNQVPKYKKAFMLTRQLLTLTLCRILERLYVSRVNVLFWFRVLMIYFMLGMHGLLSERVSLAMF